MKSNAVISSLSELAGLAGAVPGSGRAAANRGLEAQPMTLKSALSITCLAVVVATLSGAAPCAALDDPAGDLFTLDRQRMVEKQILGRGIEEENVLDAMRSVPRHLFVPEDLRDQAYVDFPQRIGSGQTISQPYMVALMTSLLGLEGGEKVLEIGTGSGYQAAVLSRIGATVYTIEIREELANQAKDTLNRLEFGNIHYRTGDGYQGWPEEAPFDAIVVTAAPPEIPESLVEQLKVGGRLVIPVGRYFQDLIVVTKRADGVKKQRVAAVRFVPMVTDID